MSAPFQTVTEERGPDGRPSRALPDFARGAGRERWAVGDRRAARWMGAGLPLVMLGLALGVASASGRGAQPAGFATLGTCLTEKSDWVVRGRAIIANAAQGEFHFPVEAMADLTAEEKARGYVPYVRHYADVITSSSRPVRGEISERAAIFACPGEYEPVSFSLFALEALRGVTAEMSDLVAPGGAHLGAENVDVRVVRRLVRTSEGDRSKYHYWPMALERRVSADVAAEDTLQYWVTVRVPPDARPTIKPRGRNWALPPSWDDPAVAAAAYRGTLTVRVPGKADVRFELALTVLPIRLEEPERLYGMCYLPTPPCRGTFPDTMDREMTDMREHGMNSMWTWPDSLTKEMADGRIVYDFGRPGLYRKDYMYYGLDAIVEAYLRAGFKRFWVCGTLDPMKEAIVDQLGYPFGSEGFSRAYLEYVGQLRRHATEKGWPNYCLHPIDEPGEPEKTSEAVRYYELIKKEFPGERTFADFGPWKGEDRALIPVCDILCLCIPNPDHAGKVAAAGKELWVYNIGSLGHQPKLDRAMWGFSSRKIGARGHFQWAYQWWVEDSVAGGFPSCIRYTQPAPDGPIPTPAWEAVREGIDDERYMVTLDKLIRRAGEAHPAAATARQALAAILAPVPGGDHPVIGGYRDTFVEQTPSIAFDRWRWTIAGHVLRLQSVRP